MGLAWNDTGHRVAAKLAERRMDPRTRAEVGRLLAAVGEANVADAACWADEQRNSTTGRWHYVNFRLDPNRPNDIPSLPKGDHIVVAINEQLRILKDRKRSDRDRGQALRYLLHLVADAHQPMHAVTRVTKRFPEGDRGGNDLKIDRRRDKGVRASNLHALWDQGGGAFPGARDGAYTDQTAQQIVNRLKSRVVSLADVAKQDPRDWALESYRIAASRAYDIQERKAPSDRYLQRCRDISEQRILLAGHRLAELLTRALR